MIKHLMVLILLLVPLAASAECTPVAKLKAANESVQWRPLTAREMVFLQGVFAMNPITHPGLPVGDKAFLVSKAGEENSIVVWTDGSATLSCDSMIAPKALVDMLSKLKGGGGDDL